MEWKCGPFRKGRWTLTFRQGQQGKQGQGSIRRVSLSGQRGTKTLRVLARSVGALGLCQSRTGEVQSRSSQWKNRIRSSAPGCQRRRKREETQGVTAVLEPKWSVHLGVILMILACSQINQAQTAPQPLLRFALWHSFPEQHPHHCLPRPRPRSLLTPDKTSEDVTTTHTHPHHGHSTSASFSHIVVSTSTYTTSTALRYTLYCIVQLFLATVLLLSARFVWRIQGEEEKLGTSFCCCFRTFQVSRVGRSEKDWIFA